MAPTKRFAKYSTDLLKALEILQAIEPAPKGIGKALTLIKNVEKSAAKYAGDGACDGAPKAKVPRKLNPYMVFAQENRAKVVAELGPGAKVSEVGKRLGELWRASKGDSPAPVKKVPAEKKAPAKKAAKKA